MINLNRMVSGTTRDARNSMRRDARNFTPAELKALLAHAEAPSQLTDEEIERILTDAGL